jgi:hypothetical protein
MRIITEEKRNIIEENAKYRGLETVERLISHIRKGRMTKNNALAYLKLEKQYLKEKVCEACRANEKAEYTGELEGIKIGEEIIREINPVLVEGQLLTELDEGTLITPCKVNLNTGQIKGVVRSECCPNTEMVIIDSHDFLVVDCRVKAEITQEETGEKVFWY